MKYYTTCYPDENGDNVIETLSEQEILNDYWDYWYGKMCEKFGKETVDSQYSKQDCIEDWCVVHWAAESDSKGIVKVAGG